MGFVGTMLLIFLIIIILTVSSIYVLRDRLLNLAVRSVGVSEYHLTQLSWHGCRRLRVVLHKGPVHCVQLESAKLHLPGTGHAVLQVLWILLRLVLAVAVGGKWAEAGRRPLAVLRLQDLKLELRNKKPHANGSGSGSAGGEPGPGLDRTASDGGSIPQEPTPRNSGDGSGRYAEAGDGGMGPGTAAVPGQRRWSRRHGDSRDNSGGGIALPEPLLRLLPLVRIELSDLRVRAEADHANPQVISGESAAASTSGWDVAPLPLWEARLASLAVAASSCRSSDDGSTGEDVGMGCGGDTSASNAGARGISVPANGSGKADTRRADQRHAGHSKIVTPREVASMEGSGVAEGAPSFREFLRDPRQTQTQTHSRVSLTTALTVSFSGMEVALRKPRDRVGALAETAAGTAAAAASEAVLITASCSALTVMATFGRFKRLSAKAGTLGAVAVDVQEVQVDCRVIADAGCHAQSDGGSNGCDSERMKAASMATAAEAMGVSPLATALMAVLTATSGRGGSSSSKNIRSGKVVFRRRELEQHPRHPDHRSGSGVTTAPGLTDILAGRLLKPLCNLLPEKVSLKFAGVRAAARIITPAAAPRGSSATTAATVQVILGASNVDVINIPETGITSNDSNSVSSKPLLDMSVQLGPLAALASPGSAAPSAAAAPLYFGMQQLVVRAQATEEAAAAAPQLSGQNSSNGASVKLCCSLGVHVDLPATILQIRPQMLLPGAADLASDGRVDVRDGHIVSGQQLLQQQQPCCYSLLFRGIAAKSNYSVSVSTEAATAAGAAAPLHHVVHGNSESSPQGTLSMLDQSCSPPSELRSQKHVKGVHSLDAKAVADLAVEAIAAAAARDDTISYEGAASVGVSDVKAAPSQTTPLPAVMEALESGALSDLTLISLDAATAAATIWGEQPSVLQTTTAGGTDADRAPSPERSTPVAGAEAPISNSSPSTALLINSSGEVRMGSELPSQREQAPLVDARGTTEEAVMQEPAGTAVTQAVPEDACDVSRRSAPASSAAGEAVPAAMKAGDIIPAASLVISIQDLEIYGSCNTASDAAVAVTTAPQGASAQMTGEKYDIVHLKRTTLNAVLTKIAPAAAAHAAQAEGSTVRLAVPAIQSMAVAASDVNVALGHLNVTLHPVQLMPLLRLAGHAKLAAAAAFKASTALKAAAAAAAAAATQAKGAMSAALGSLLQDPLQAPGMFSFPLDVMSPETLPGLKGADAAVGHIGSREDNPKRGCNGGGRRRRGRGLPEWLQIRSLVVNAPTGIQLAISADTLLEESFRTYPPGSADSAASSSVLPTTLEARMGSWTLATWPAGTAATPHGGAAADTTVVDVSATGFDVTVIRASAATASTPSPQQADRQQVLRIDRVNVLWALAAVAAAAGSAVDTSTEMYPGSKPAGAAVAAPATAPQRTDTKGWDEAEGLWAAAITARRDLVRITCSGTHGSLDADLVLAVLSAAQVLADVTMEVRRENHRFILSGNGAGSWPVGPAVPTLKTGGVATHSGKVSCTSSRRPDPLFEILATDTELNIASGAAEIVTLVAAEARGSSGLAAAAVQAMAVRVNGRRLLDVEYLTVETAEQLNPSSSAETSKSAFTALAVAAAAEAAGLAAQSAPPTPPLSLPSDSKSSPGGSRGGGGKRHISRGSADMEGLSNEAFQSMPPSQQQPAYRRHHRRHASGPPGSGSGRSTVPTAAVPAQAAPTSKLQPLQRPAPAVLRPWTSLGQPSPGPGHGVGATAAAASASSTSAAAAGVAGGAVKRTMASKEALPGAVCEARRRAARERFVPAAPNGDGGVGDGTAQRVVSMDVTLYGVTLTVSYDESAARVYVMTELWSRAVKQVLGPRITRLKETLQNLKSKGHCSNGVTTAADTLVPSGCANTDLPTGSAAPDGPSGSGEGTAAASSGRPDKAFVEILLNARRLAVVVEHQPLEAWLALHGSALRATATQRSLYERFIQAHGNSASKGRRDMAAAVAGASAAAVAESATIGRSAKHHGSKRLGPAARLDAYSESSISRSISSSNSSGSSSSSSDSNSSTSSSSDSSSDSDDDGCARQKIRKLIRRKKRAPEEAYAAAPAAALPAMTATGSPGGATSGRCEGAHDEWKQVMRDLAATYVAACRAIQAAAASAAANTAHGGGGGTKVGMAVLASCPGGALLHLSVAEAQAALMVAPPGCNRGREVAEAVIVQVDSPTSERVTFQRVVAISLAAAASDLQACLAGCGGAASPALTCSQVALSGWIIRARQLAAPPQSFVVHWPVGRYHSAPVATALRFCRPNMKTYTDLRIEVDGVSAAFGTAMEPVLAQLAKALKQRVVPPQPQLLQPSGKVAQVHQQQQGPGSIALPGTPGPAATSPSGLLPWDNIRYVWRGGMTVMIRRLNAVVAASSLELPINAFDPRLALSASTLGIKISSGRVDVTGTALALLGFARGPGRGPDEPLVTVPLLSLPLLKTSVHTSFKQQSPTPYAFPVLAKAPPEDAVQGPVDVPVLMRSSSWSMALEISLVRDAVAHLPTNKAPSATSAASSTITAVAASGLPQPRVLWQSGLQTQLLPLQPQVRTHPQHSGERTPRSQLEASTPAIAAGGLEGLGRAYIGEMQVKFLMGLVNGLASSAPVMTRGSWKRRTHFDPPRPRPLPGASPQPAGSIGTSGSNQQQQQQEAITSSGASGVGGGSVSLGALLSRVDIDLSADVFDIVHDAQDPDDPSDLVCLRARNLRYANSFSYSRANRTSIRSNGTARTTLVARPVMTALSVEAYDIRIFTPSASASGPSAATATGTGHPQLAAAAATAAAGLRRRHGPGGGGGGVRGAGSDPSLSSDPWDGADPAAGPAFGAGLIASCDCLLLRQAAPEGAPAPGGTSGRSENDTSEAGARRQGLGQQVQPPPTRPIRIVVQDVQVLCTMDSRDAVITTTMHIIQAFACLPAARAAAAAASAAAVATAGGVSAATGVSTGRATAAEAAVEGSAPGTRSQRVSGGRNQAGRQGERRSLSGGGGAGDPGSGENPDQGASAGEMTGIDRKRVPPTQQQGTGKTPLVLPLRPAPSHRPDTDPSAEPQIDPRVVADERALVTQLRQQNEERRAAARRRRLECSSVSTASTATPVDPDQTVSLDSDSDDERVLGSTLDPSDVQDRDVDVDSEQAQSTGMASATGNRTPAAQSAERHPAMQTQYEVEFVRVQVGLISEYGGGGACLVLGADCAVLRGGRAPVVAPTASTTTVTAGGGGAAASRGTGAAASAPGVLKVLTFDVETLQAYAARQDQSREGALPSLVASGLLAGGGGAGSVYTAGGGGNTVRPSFSPLTDALAASAAAAAAVGGGGSGGNTGLQQRPADVAAAFVVASGGGAPAPVVWLQVVNGQLVPSGTALPGNRAATGGGSGDGGAMAADVAASGSGIAGSEPGSGARVVMQKILNPFGIHLTSSRPVVLPASSVDTLLMPVPVPSTTAPQLPPKTLLQSQRLTPSGGKTVADDGGAGGSGSGLKLDIDVPAITGQMESWQFQLLLAVINETLAAPLPKVVMLTRGSGGQPLPAVESALEVAINSEALLSAKHRLRCLQYESLNLALYLTHGSAGFHDPYPVLSAPGAALALYPAPLHQLMPADALAAPSGQPYTMAFAGTYTSTLFKPVVQTSAAPRATGVSGSGGPAAAAGAGDGAGADAGVVRGVGPATTPVVPYGVLKQAFLAPRPLGLSSAQLAALLRRNQELLLHWALEQLAGAKDFVEEFTARLVRVRSEVSAALEAQQHQRRKQATAVAVRLGKFGWALINREGAPFVQAELKGLSFHHSLDRDHTGTTKIVMHTADMWELRPGAAAGGAGGGGRGGSGGAGGGAGASVQGGQAQPATATAATAPMAVVGSVSSDPVYRGVGGGSGGSAMTGGAGAGGGTAAGSKSASGAGGSSSSSILSLWRPDESSSWDDDPLLRMYVVHGGVDAQYVTYEHIEVYLHPLQVRLTYALAHMLVDYFELRDDEREEGTGREDEGSRGAARREKSKGSGAGKGSDSSAAASGGALAAGGVTSTLTSPAKTGRSTGGSWFSRRSAAPAMPESSAGPMSTAAMGLTGVVLPSGQGQSAMAAAASLHSGQSDSGPRMMAAALTDSSQPVASSSPADKLAATAAGVTAATASLQRGSHSTISDPQNAGTAAARNHGRHSRGPSASVDEQAAVAASLPPGATEAAAVLPAIDGAAVAAAFPAATALAVRYGPAFRRRSDGRITILVDVADHLLPTVVAAVAVGPSTGRGSRAAVFGGDSSSGSAATGPQGSGGRGHGRTPRQLRFRHVRFNRMAARVTYTGPRLSIGSAGGWGLMIDARVYRNIVGGWKAILAKYKWDVIRSVIKSVAGIQASKLKELRGVGGGGGAAAANVLLSGGGGMESGAGGLWASGLAIDDLDPDITFTADGNALSAVTGSTGLADVGGGPGSSSGSAFGFGSSGTQRAAALLGGVKKRAAAFMSAGGAAGARLRQVASGSRTSDRTTISGVGGVVQISPLERGVTVSPEEVEMEGEEAQGPERLETAEAMREMVREDAAQEYERIKRAAAAAQARATRLAALLGDVPSAGGHAGMGSMAGLGGVAGGKARGYRL